ncbi:hypothetical protein DICSQDRAFT_60239 [Dichomitus squalens LYAD-421 SS1]|uniref:Uncharacterized protein n=1 Tax=Dichomitus squalens (strain LYAD-421) TaxID=732165 RepID=R7T2L4_DICSQ|nr:uncharacterized protein DICSQDRAFT_60239 [Dichomitus squalens LYAD-421 SS1]EJF61662.1 hypothetical protein DICSQDRAFT_60239 [Dichomitus squalens LYAD-421 SS1]
MHLLTLNMTELVLGLLRGKLGRSDTDSVDDWDWACLSGDAVWQAHGKLVAEASLYLPGSFDRPPRNPAEKISSGYKAWEYMYYFYGLLPGLLWAIQKPKHHYHFCKLIAGARVALLLETPVNLRPLAHKLLVEYVEEFEENFYARRVDRLHFCRQALHALVHLMPENVRVGPAWLHSQWPLENAIGNLTREIGSHVKPYENLSLRGLRRAQISALVAMFPDALEEPIRLPAGAVELGDRYVLLHPTARTPHLVSDVDGVALHSFFTQRAIQAPEGWRPRVAKWGRLRLPNGQVARTAWKEMKGERRGRPVHRSRMVKVRHLADDRFAEVQYFFRLKRMHEDGGTDDVDFTLAMVSVFISPDPAILRETHGVLMACRYRGEQSREVVDVKQIKSVVAMVPLTPRREEAEDPHAAELYSNRFFVMDRLGFDMTWIGREESLADDEDSDDDT